MDASSTTLLQRPYQGLGESEIRVLVLQPGDLGAALEGWLHIVCLPEAEGSEDSDPIDWTRGDSTESTNGASLQVSYAAREASGLSEEGSAASVSCEDEQVVRGSCDIKIVTPAEMRFDGGEGSREKVSLDQTHDSIAWHGVRLGSGSTTHNDDSENEDSIDSTISPEEEVGVFVSDRSVSEHADENNGSQKHEYEAISYVWGNTALTHVIEILSIGTLRITQSLFQALQRFRLPHRARRLWADQICIDQSNLAERATQVGAMHKVFWYAPLVLVWLGSEEESDTLAFATSAAYGASSDEFDNDVDQVVVDSGSFAPPECCRCCGTRVAYKHQEPFHAAVTSLINILERPWFSRVWTVQEAYYESCVTVYAGPHHISWNWLKATVFRFCHPDRPRSEDLSIGSLARLTRNRLLPLTFCADGNLLDEMTRLSGRDCWDARDRVYAVQRLHGQSIVGVEIDYAERPIAIFARLVGCVLSGGTGMGDSKSSTFVLAMAGTDRPPVHPSEPNSETKPSWVPHFHYLTNRSRTKYWLYKYNETRWSTSNCLYDLEIPSELKVKGFQFAEVGRLLEGSYLPCPTNAQSKRDGQEVDIGLLVDLAEWYFRCRRFILAICKESEGLLAQGETLGTSFPRLAGTERLITEASRLCRAALGAPGASSFNKRFRELLQCGWIHDIQGPESENGVDLFTAVASVNLAHLYTKHDMHGIDFAHLLGTIRPFLGSQLGLEYDGDRILCCIQSSCQAQFAWVPPNARAGDAVCMFASAPYPFVVRSDRSGGFKLLGDAFFPDLQNPWDDKGSDEEDSDEENSDDENSGSEDSDDDDKTNMENVKNILLGDGPDRFAWIALR